MCITCPPLTQKSTAAALHLNKGEFERFPTTAIPQEHKINQSANKKLYQLSS